MSTAAAYSPLVQLQLWQARRSIALSLRLDGVKGVSIGRCEEMSRRRQRFGARRGSEVLEISRQTGPRAAMQCRAEYDLLTEAAARLSDGPDRVAPVIWASPERGLIMSGVPDASPMEVPIRAGGLERSSSLIAATRWLSTYADATAVEDGFGGGFWIRQRAESRSAMPKGPDRDRMKRLIEAMRTARNKVGHGRITRARSHGDFRVQNLRYADGTVWGSGLRTDGWGAVMRDIARLIVDLELTAPRGGDDGPMGLDATDLDAVRTGARVLRDGEFDALLPYFVAVDLSGRLLSSGRQDRARALCDRVCPP